MTDLEKRAMWTGFYDELDRIAADAQVEKLARACFAKTAGLKTWAVGKLRGVGKHVTQGAKAEVAAEAKKHKKKLIAAGLSIPAAAGAAGYVGGRQGAKDGRKKQATITKTAEPKKDDGWERPSDSLWAKHKKKIIGGSLALATAGGLAKHVHKHVYAPQPAGKAWDGPSYLRRWRAKVKVKRTNEPFTPKGAKDGKLHPIKDIRVQRSRAPHEHDADTVVHKALGGAVASPGRGKTVRSEDVKGEKS